MSKRNRVPRGCAACRWVVFAAMGAFVVSGAGAADAVSLNEIKAHWRQQRESIKSLHIVTRTEYEYFIDTKEAQKLLGLVYHMTHSEDDQAVQGDKLYQRRVWWRGSDAEDGNEASVVNGREVVQVLNGEMMGRSECEVLVGPDGIKRKGRPSGSVGRTGTELNWRGLWTCYFRNVMLSGSLGHFYRLPEPLEDRPFVASKTTEEVDGAKCVVLTADYKVTGVRIGNEVKEWNHYHDKLWLDLERGLALRKRETTSGVGKPLTRVLNSSFKEVAPGFWLPQENEEQWIAPSEGEDWPDSYRGKPVFVQRSKLIRCVVNDVPDDLFDLERYAKLFNLKPPPKLPVVKERPFAEAMHEGGQLKYIQGIPVLFLQGTPEEIGTQHGALLAEVAKPLIDLPRIIRGQEATSPTAMRVGRAMFRRAPERYQRELEALADAARLDEDGMESLLLLNTPGKYAPRLWCSCLLVEPQRSAEGQMLFGRNLDFGSFGCLDRLSLVAVYRPEGRHAFASVTWPAYLGIDSGINDVGLALATNSSGEPKDHAPRFSPDGMPQKLLFRQILEECATIEEAEKLLRSSNRTSSVLLVACDRRRAVVFEILPGKMITRNAEDHLLACTNHFRTPELGAPRRMQGCNRYETLQKYWQREEPLAWTDVAQAMREVGASFTLQTMIFEPESLRLRLAVGANPPATARPLNTLNLKELFPYEVSPALSRVDGGEVSAVEAAALERNARPRWECFSLLDENKDERLTLEELLVDYPTPEAVKQGTDLFGLLDSDRDGKLTLEEFKAKPRKALFLQRDLNADGALSEEEFARGEMKAAPPARARRVFGLVDKDDDGLVDFGEFLSRSADENADKSTHRAAPTAETAAKEAAAQTASDAAEVDDGR